MTSVLYFDETAYLAGRPQEWPLDMPMREAMISAITEHLEKRDLHITTSGSTGAPKPITHTREAVVKSINATAAFFVLPPGSTALLALPVDKIAGRMMLLRALECGWNLIVEAPSSTPLVRLQRKIDFAAMTPMQLSETLRRHPEKLKLIGTLIIGGAQVEHHLRQQLQATGCIIYETYGMTETLTHVAVRRIAPEPEELFTCLPGVTVERTPEGCLVLLGDRFTSPLVTKDLGEVFDATRFRWVGRSDFTINSGGLKIQPETVEQSLIDLIHRRFIITSEPDDTLGRRVVLLLEGAPLTLDEEGALTARMRERLQRHEVPKVLRYAPHLPTTSNGKIIRPRP